jgi:hypothetical protein
MWELLGQTLKYSREAREEKRIKAEREQELHKTKLVASHLPRIGVTRGNWLLSRFLIHSGAYSPVDSDVQLH